MWKFLPVNINRLKNDPKWLDKFASWITPQKLAEFSKWDLMHATKQ